jgi:glycosyltransferase involved in cell wall biosynthesis
VIPVLDERQRIPATVERARSELAPWFETEVIVVDDGSTDGTGDAAAAVGATVVRQANAGRLAARRTGLERAAGELVLFLDSRVALLPGSAQFVAGRLDAGETVWNGHVHVESGGNPYGLFWNAVTELAFSAYFAEPRTTSFGLDEFDRFPKGTTCFLAPAVLLREAFAAFRSGYRDERNANDDTPIIRWVAARERIHISPRFACTYAPRRSLPAFVRHAFHRGTVFVDGHGRRGARLRPVVIAFYPATVATAWLAVRHPLLVLTGAAASGAGLGLVARAKGRPPAEAGALAALSLPYVLAHGAGMWRGLALLADARLRRG